jgi:hypothetical protein
VGGAARRDPARGLGGRRRRPGLRVRLWYLWYIWYLQTAQEFEEQVMSQAAAPAADSQQRIEELSRQLVTLRGYL